MLSITYADSSKKVNAECNYAQFCYDEGHLCLASVMLSFANKVVHAECNCSKCHYGECH